jgi:hypothetical protein
MSIGIFLDSATNYDTANDDTANLDTASEGTEFQEKASTSIGRGMVDRHRALAPSIFIDRRTNDGREC